MTVVLSALLVMLAGAPPVQWVTSCQDTNPALERLAQAIQRGDIEFVQGQLDGGADLNQSWRDTPAQICRSLLLRSVWYRQEEIFRLLLKRGSDPGSIPRESLSIPVRDGHVEMVRTLLALGVKPHDEDEILAAGLESRNLAMLDLLLVSGVSIVPSRLRVYDLTNDITRFLVPRHLSPNAETPVGNEACDIERIFRLLRKDQDGCEGAVGPLWLHFVVTGNHELVDFMIRNGADLSLAGQGVKRFTGMEVARARKDQRMIRLLKR